MDVDFQIRVAVIEILKGKAKHEGVNISSGSGTFPSE